MICFLHNPLFCPLFGLGLRFGIFHLSSAVPAVWVWGNAEKVLRETPPSCSKLPTKSFPFSERVFMPPLRRAGMARLMFVPVSGKFDSSALNKPSSSSNTTLLNCTVARSFTASVLYNLRPLLFPLLLLRMVWVLQKRGCREKGRGSKREGGRRRDAQIEIVGGRGRVKWVSAHVKHRGLVARQGVVLTYLLSFLVDSQ